MIGCESALVEGTVKSQGYLAIASAPEGEMGLLPGGTCSDSSVEMKAALGCPGLTRKRIEGGTPRFLQVAGDGCMTNSLAQRFFSLRRVRVPLLCSLDTQVVTR